MTLIFCIMKKYTFPVFIRENTTYRSFNGGMNFMLCPNCGADVPEGSKFCQKCGNPMPVAAAQPTPAQPVTPTQPVQPQQFDQQPTQPVQPQQFDQQPTQPVQPQQFDQQPTQPVQPQQFTQQAQQPTQPQQFDQQAQPTQTNQAFGQSQQNMAQGMQPQGAAGQGAVAFDFSGFSRIMSDPLSIMTLAGAFLVFLSVFIPKWLSAKVEAGFLGTYSDSFGLWGLGKFYILVAFILIFIALYAVAIRLSILKAPFVDQISALPYSEVYYGGVVLFLLLVLLLFFFLGAAKAYAGDEIESLKEWGVKVSAGPSVSWYMALIGSLLMGADGLIVKLQNKSYSI